MFVDFDEIFNLTEYQRQKLINHLNNSIIEGLKRNGECCSNCKHFREVYGGHDLMHYKCSKTHEWIEEDIKCEHYKFCGFIGDNYGK